MISPDGWKAQAICAVQQWLEMTPQSSGTRWRSVGTARPAPQPEWLLVDRRGDPPKPEALNDLCLAADGGPDVAVAYPVDKFRQVDGVLWLEKPARLPAGQYEVWTRVMSERFLVERLLQGLKQSGHTPLADAFAEGKLARSSAGHTPAGFTDAQAEAYRACVTRGVRLVWGPPGTGKTRVLAASIEDLIEAGKRVLLVSTANIAVDNALQAVVSRLRPEPGKVLRVGPPQMSELVNNADVHLDRLAARASADVDSELRDVEQELAEMAAVEAAVAELSAEVGDFTPSNYMAALERLAREEVARELQQQLDDAELQLRAAEQAVAFANGQMQVAQDEWQALSPARSAWANVDQLGAQLEALETERAWHRAAVARAEATLAKRLGSWRAKRAAKERDMALQRHLAFEQRAVIHQRRLVEFRGQQQAVARAVSLDDLHVADLCLAAANAEVGEAWRVESATRGRLQQVLVRRSAEAEGPMPTPSDRELVRRCESQDLSAKYGELARARKAMEVANVCKADLEIQHRQLHERARKLRDDAAAQLISEARLVATTLARSRVHRALANMTFDVVLVDEAGAASLVEVMLALCRAREAAVLFGDFLQLPPIPNDRLRKRNDGDVRRWVLSDPFSHVGIRTPANALEHDGCVCLLHQFRFGPELRSLANDVIYRDLRDATELEGVTARRETEIVLVDTASLGELAEVRRPEGRQKGWWPAGLVLSRALAEHHAQVDGGVGLVTPYRYQSDAVLAGLRDRGLISNVAAGTVHAFQGREFPVVVFDLVEDGRGRLAKAIDGSDFAYDSRRLFGVGITRAQHRLYLIANFAVVNRASRGPLAAVASAIRSGRVQIWSGAALLGMAEPSTEYAGSAFADVRDILQRLVTVSNITDEKSFQVELQDKLTSATQQVWMWSPWVGNQAKNVVPVIAAAVSRGVDVRIFIRPDTDGNMRRDWAQRQIALLRDSRATVIRSDHEHRKVVVIDGHTVLFGSANPLSQPVARNTRESMLTMEGATFAELILEDLRAHQLGTPWHCPMCRQQCEVRRQGGRRQAWFWHCPGCRTRESIPV